MPVPTHAFARMPAKAIQKLPPQAGAPPPVYTGTGDPLDIDENATGPTISYFQDDFIYGTPGSDIVVLGPTSPFYWIMTGSGDDSVDVSAPTAPTQVLGTDEYGVTVHAGSGSDTIIGGSFIDHLWGGSGSDNIQGGGGNDIIGGGYGADTLQGGSGNDTFEYLSARDTGDTIMDFTSGEDILSFVRPGTLAFQGQVASFAAVAPNSLAYIQTSDGIIVAVDWDGVAGADMAIHLLGVTNFQTTDYILYY